MGNWNIKVGERREGDMVGKTDQKRNKRGIKLDEVCDMHNFG